MKIKKTHTEFDTIEAGLSFWQVPQLHVFYMKSEAIFLTVEGCLNYW